MKYLAIAVLLAIVVGAAIHYVNHADEPSPRRTTRGVDATLSLFAASLGVTP